MKKYWLEALVFAIIGGVLLNANLPNITWMNTDSDGAHYILAAKYLTTAHHMSAPLYLLIGNLFLKIPLGTEAWRMGLMSVVGTMGTAVFIYLILRHLLADNRNGRWYALISVLVFGGSALIISQSTIIETYTLSMMCGVGGYYFALKKKWIWASVIIGIGLAIHPFLSFIVWAVLFVAYKEMRNWRRYSITIAFFAFYLYIPIVAQVNPNANMWGNENPEGFIGGTLGMVVMLTGGLSMWDMPKRMIDTLLILGVSFGMGIIPMIWYFIKTRRWRNSLLWLTLIPIVYFAINLAAPTYVYMIVSVAFGSIAVGLGLSKLHIRWALATCLVAVGLLGFNANYFDIGRTLDPEMSAMKFYNEELPKISDGEYFMGGGWTWSMVYLYNRQEGRDIIPISIDALPDKNYWPVLDDMGVNYDRNLLPFDSEMGYISKQGKLALSIAEHNDGVWIAKETKPEVYQYVIEPAKGNEEYVGRWIGQEIEPSIQWKPSNPYLYISGQLEVAEWHHILWSSHNAFYVISFIVYGFGLSWLVMRFWKRKRKKVADDEVAES
ncbi:MAG: DUF2723 domain-containing protein [Thiotrichaceae bacterium]